MKPEMREKILAFNREVSEKRQKAEDMDVIINALSKLPPGQLNKLLTDEVLTVLAKYSSE